MTSAIRRDIRSGSRVAAFALALTLTHFTHALGAIQLSNSPTAGVGALNFLFTPDSSRVVYTAEMNTASITELFSAATDMAGTQIQLSNTPVVGGELAGSLTLTPDGTTIVYNGDLETDQQFELFSASTSIPGTQVKLNDTPSHAGVVTVQPRRTPDGTRAFYLADYLVDDEFELFSAVIGVAGTQVRLTNQPVAGGDVLTNTYFSTADSARVVFRGDLDTDGVDELYSASTTAAGTQIKLNTTPQPLGDVANDLLLTADGNRVIYRGDLETDLQNELYSAPTGAAGMQIKLSGPPVAGFSGVDSLYRLTADGGRVMYTGVLDAAGVTELYSAPTDAAGLQIKLNNTPVADGDVGATSITPDGARAVFLGDLVVNDRQDLYSAPLDMAGQQIQVNTNTSGGNVSQGFAILPDSARVVYSGNLNMLGQSELYSAPIDGSGPQITLSTTSLGDAGDVIGIVSLSPDASRVLYRGTLTTAGVTDLYTASTTTAGTQVALSNFATAQLIVTPRFTLDGQFVVYGVDTDGDLAQDVVFAADALGQNPPLQISDPLIAGGRITFFSITPDSQKVIYRADQDALGIFNLFAASLPTMPAGLPGDYNNDGTVNAADYVVWRKNEGTTNMLPNDPIGGTIDERQFNQWRMNFGNMAGSGASAAVPEPASVRLLILCVAALGLAGGATPSRRQR